MIKFGKGMKKKKGNKVLMTFTTKTGFKGRVVKSKLNLDKNSIFKELKLKTLKFKK